MRCIGRNKNLSRCKKTTPFLYCGNHNKQWIGILLFSIPAFVGLYAGIFQDLIKPGFLKESDVENKFKIEQSNEILELANILNLELIGFTYVLDTLNEYCNFENHIRCDSYYEFVTTLFPIRQARRVLEKQDFEFEPQCINAVIVEKDSALTLQDSTIYYFLGKQISKGTCNIDLRSILFVYDSRSLQFLDKYYTNNYIPQDIKDSIKELLSLEYKMTKLKKVSNENDRWFILLHPESMKSINANKEHLVYEVLKEGEPIGMLKFMELLYNLNYAIDYWMSDNNLI